MAHLIQRLSVELTPTDPVTDRRQEAEVRRWMNAGEWRQALSDQLDQLVPEDMVLRIPRIEIEISTDSETGFLDQLLTAVLNEVRGFREKQQGKALQKDIYLHEIALFYLAHGYLPTSAPSFLREDVHGFFEAQLTDECPEFWQAIRQIAPSQPVILLRLYPHMGMTNFRKLVCKILHINLLVPQWIAGFQDAATRTGHYPGFDKKVEIAFWQNLFSALPSLQTFEAQTAFEQYLTAQIKSGTALPKTPAQLPDTENTENDETGIFLIENAGLVLLVPFFSTLFQKLGWVRGKEWENTEHQQQAVRLLAYMTHGTAESYEFDWQLNKILCGLPLNAEIDPSDPLSPDTLALADEMLASMITQWSVLKNMSVPRLQNDYLMRQGKLSRSSEGGWKLTVPRKTEDVMLERIPWGFSVIKLPWMNNILFVDW